MLGTEKVTSRVRSGKQHYLCSVWVARNCNVDGVDDGDDVDHGVSVVLVSSISRGNTVKYCEVGHLNEKDFVMNGC